MANAQFSELFSGFKIPNYDYGELVLTDSDTETITLKMGGAAGDVVATIVVNYTSSEKTTLSNWSVTLS